MPQTHQTHACQRVSLLAVRSRNETASEEIRRPAWERHSVETVPESWRECQHRRWHGRQRNRSNLLSLLERLSRYSSFSWQPFHPTSRHTMLATAQGICADTPTQLSGTVRSDHKKKKTTAPSPHAVVGALPLNSSCCSERISPGTVSHTGQCALILDWTEPRPTTMTCPAWHRPKTHVVILAST